MKLQSRKKINQLALLFALTYMASYLTRINYGAIISEMENATAFSRDELSMAVTGSFITYGVGQIISGILGDRFSPKNLISLGFVVTILMNVCIPFCQSPYQMLGFWCMNGFAQSFMWPPLVRLMTNHLTDEDYKQVTTQVSWGSSGGTLLLYLISPLIISLFNWKGVFFFSAACGTVMLVIWNIFAKDVPKAPREKLAATAPDAVPAPKRKISLKGIFLPVTLCAMVSIALQGMLRDGITTWMPTFIDDTYNLGSAISILTGVILPIFSVLCIQFTSRLYRRKFRNPLSCSGIIFAVGTASAFMLYLFNGRSAVLSVLFSALLTGCMHGVNLLLVCMIPAYFRKYNNVSTASGILNACTYVGSAASTYGIAVLSELIGWDWTVLLWAGIAVVGTSFCFICAKPWEKQFMDSTEVQDDSEEINEETVNA